MDFNFVPMNETYAKEMLESKDWKYEGEYEIYNYENEKEWIMEKESWGRFLLAVINGDNELIGELSLQFLKQNEVNFTSLPKDERGILWIGFGLRPDLTGKGYGCDFVEKCVDFAVNHLNYKGDYIGLGVGSFNKRAVKTYEKIGFKVYHSYEGEVYGKNTEVLYMRKRVKK